MDLFVPELFNIHRGQFFVKQEQLKEHCTEIKYVIFMAANPHNG